VPNERLPWRHFDGDGVNLDAAVSNLTQEKLNEYQHRSMVTKQGLTPVARV